MRCSQVIVAAVALYPITVLACIIITANHFLLDAVAGAAVLGVAHTLAAWAPQLGRGTHPGRRPCLGDGDSGESDADYEEPVLRPYGAAAAACEKRLARGGSSAAIDRTMGSERAGLYHICVQT